MSQFHESPLEIKFCSRASLFLPYSIALYDPWQPKGSSEKITFQGLPFSSLSLAVQVQVSPEFQDALFWVPLGFSHLPRFYKTSNIAIGLVVPLTNLYFWVFLLFQKKKQKTKNPNRLETEKEGISLNETDFQTLPTHTIFGKSDNLWSFYLILFKWKGNKLS